MKNTDNILAAKYQGVVITEAVAAEGYSSNNLQKLTTLFYQRLASTSYGEVADIIRELIQVIMMIAQDKAEADMYYDSVINGIGKMAIANNRMDVIQRIGDTAKIMKAGLGRNRPGLN